MCFGIFCISSGIILFILWCQLAMAQESDDNMERIERKIK